MNDSAPCHPFITPSNLLIPDPCVVFILLTRLLITSLLLPHHRAASHRPVSYQERVDEGKVLNVRILGTREIVVSSRVPIQLVEQRIDRYEISLTYHIISKRRSPSFGNFDTVSKPDRHMFHPFHKTNTIGNASIVA